MITTIITSLITMILSAALGYCIKSIKSYQLKLQQKDKEEIAIKEALKYLIQSNLTNTYYAYEKIGKIPDYVYKNWLNLFKIYKALDGNEFIDKLAEKISKWELTHTDILEK